jgi:NAD(P)H-flavin reductase/truncated hemoglobin YjbI/ferredoxin
MVYIRFDGSTYPVREGETALEALLRGGASVASSCRRGSCHTCLLRARVGDPGADARRGLRDDMVERGYFLPCVSRPASDLSVERPDLSELFATTLVQAREQLSSDVVRLLIEPETSRGWRAGQSVNVRRPGGAVRSYSIASIAEEDYFLELHVRRVQGGAVSPWLCDELAAGDEIEIQGPFGACFYEPGRDEQPLLLIGAGTGLSPLIGIARDALRSGHRGPISLFHGARGREGHYLDGPLRELALQHPSFTYTPCVSGASEGLEGGVAGGRATDVAFGKHGDLAGFRVFLCGPPGLVYDARARAYGAGAARADILADPFEEQRPFMPDDGAKLRGVAPDPELWSALRQGAGLTEILTDFYGRVFEDPRLAPFFHKVTKQRAIEKQYEFLRDVFSGTSDYMGLRPFNAHHWMIISDELFDHREALMESCLRRHGLAEHLIRRWGAFHEQFRREIVKGTQRGLMLDGVEQPVGEYEEVTLDVGALCDGCQSEIPRGAIARGHARTGELFCGGCAARATGQTSPPPRG